MNTSAPSTFLNFIELSTAATALGSADLAWLIADANISIWFFTRRYHQRWPLGPPYFFRNASSKMSISAEGTLECHSVIAKTR